MYNLSVGVARLIVTFTLIAFGSASNGQNRENIWYFGSSAIGPTEESVQPKVVCESIHLSITNLYYNGDYFSKFQMLDQTLRTGLCWDSFGNSTPIERECRVYNPDGSMKVATGDICNTPDTCQATAGNPTEIGSRRKIETADDWVSAKDARFRVRRAYSSAPGDQNPYGNFSFGNAPNYLGHDGLWRQEYNEAFGYQYAGQDPGTHAYAHFTGEKYLYSNDGSFTPVFGGHPYEVLGGSQRVVSDGNGKRLLFGYKDVWFAGLDSIVWADGYRIDIVRESNGRLQSVSDNRGQRMEYSWSNTATLNSTRYVLTKIEIDTEYDGSTFDPDFAVNYTYEDNPEFVGRLSLAEVQREDVSNATSELIAQYTYTYRYLSSVNLEYDNRTMPPWLTTHRDGRLNAIGQPFDYASFAYMEDQANGGRVASTQHFGGADRYDFGSGVTNPLGLETTYTFDDSEGPLYLQEVAGQATPNCLGTATSFDYTATGSGAEGWVYEQIEKNGSKTTFTRDARGLVLTKTEDADGLVPRLTTYTWHSTYRLPLSRTTSQLAESFAYDANGLMTSYTQTDNLTGSPTYGQTRTWTYTYTTLASGLKVLTSMDGPGLTGDGVDDVTTYTYDADGNLASVTDPVGLVTTILSVSEQGQPTLIHNPDDTKWGFTYGIDGRVLTATFIPKTGASQTSTYTYDVIGQLLSVTDRTGKTWTFTYDEARRLVKAQNPSGNVARFDYDAMGNVTRVEYAQTVGSATFWEETEFDELGRPLKTIGAMGQEWDFSHDVENNLATITDPDSNLESNSYDPLNRLIETIDRASYTTLKSYNDSDLMTEFTDPRLIDTEFTYNGFGEVIEEVSADRGTISYSYDRRGLAESMTDARGIVSEYSYDDAGRLISRDFLSASAEDVTLTYDHIQGSNLSGLGKLYSITDETGQLVFNYVENTGVLLRQIWGIDQASYNVNYSFDNEDRLIQLRYPSGHKMWFTRDADGRIIKITFQKHTNNSGVAVPDRDVVKNITYKPSGGIASMLFIDGYTETRGYDLSYRLTSILDAKSGSPTLRNVTYGYEDRDNLSIISDLLTPANSETFSYTAREHLAGASGPYGDLAFTYDGVGNRLSRVLDIGGGAQTDSYTYPSGSNRLEEISLAAGGSRDFTYDAAGNVTYDDRTGGGYGYAYNAAGRMESFSISGVVQAEYLYNALGQQVKRTLTQTGEVIHAVFDQDGHRIAEYLYDPIAQSSALLREYIWLDDLPVGLVENDTLYLIRADHIGRPVFATDTSGSVVWTATYLPFGGVETSTGTPIALRFPGQWYQSESGLHQNWMRDYDPATGRYLQADPLGLVDGASVYNYAQQNPMRYGDPRGEYTEVISWEPTGWGASSFGHASVTINGTSYSYGPSGMFVGPSSDYYGRQNFRDGFGQPVRLTPNQEAALARCLVRDQGEYSVLNNSCTDPIESCLCAVGVCIGDSYTPLGMMQRLRQHPSSYGINWHQPTRRDRYLGSHAPWAK